MQTPILENNTFGKCIPNFFDKPFIKMQSSSEYHHYHFLMPLIYPPNGDQTSCYNLFKMLINGFPILSGNIPNDSRTSDLDKTPEVSKNSNERTSMTGIPIMYVTWK